AFHVRCVIINDGTEVIVDEKPMRIIAAELKCNACAAVRKFDLSERPLVGSTQIRIWMKMVPTPCIACGCKGVALSMTQGAADLAVAGTIAV
ncbi:MAG: hypothetical protein JWM74_4410, partial [Myxococcaceae bacterium]|nr:hypothetical protein [Myxococcaceae bacterium]